MIIHRTSQILSSHVHDHHDHDYSMKNPRTSFDEGLEIERDKLQLNCSSIKLTYLVILIIVPSSGTSVVYQTQKCWRSSNIGPFGLCLMTTKVTTRSC